MQTANPLTRECARIIYGFADALANWQDRRRGRLALMRLPERTLKDMGLCRGQAAAEYEKPFWQD